MSPDNITFPTLAVTKLELVEPRAWAVGEACRPEKNFQAIPERNRVQEALQADTFCLLIGHSQSGKSTLARAAARALKDTHNVVYIALPKLVGTYFTVEAEFDHEMNPSSNARGLTCLVDYFPDFVLAAEKRYVSVTFTKDTSHIGLIVAYHIRAHLLLPGVLLCW